MAKDFIDVYFEELLRPLKSRIEGSIGEWETTLHLSVAAWLGKKGKILQNVYVPQKNGGTTEIDVIYITQKGVFVLESKNYCGWIYGDERKEQWIVSYPNGEKHFFYNPVKQNANHIRALEEHLGNKIPFYSIIVFSDRSTLKSLFVQSANVHVIQSIQMQSLLEYYWKNNAEVLCEAQVEALYNVLLPLTKVDEQVKREHVERAREQQIQKESRGKTSISRETKICAKCGKRMVVRVAKNGNNAGQSFWGCSDFPKCRNTEKID